MKAEIIINGIMGCKFNLKAEYRLPFYVNDHRLKAGGFLLRLKAGLVRHSADWVPQTNLVF